METISVTPIGRVKTQLDDPKEEFWGSVISVIEIDPDQFQPDALKGLDEFSHLEVLFQLDQVPTDKVVSGTRHPRNNPALPKVGIFAQRAKARPNRIGATICKIGKIEGLKITVNGLDAFDGSPILDIKPVMAEFIPERADVKQPQWSRELMTNYFSSASPK